jgi:hypothetical protein
MLNARIFETRSAKLIVAVACVLLLAAFQVAVQAKPAHAWEVSLSIKGGGKITETTPRNLISTQCSPGGTAGFQSPSNTPTGQIWALCSPGDPNGEYPNFDVIEYRADPLPGYNFVGWRNSDDASTNGPVLCDNSNNSPNYGGQNCRFQIFANLKAQAVFQDITPPSQPSINSTTPTRINRAVSFEYSIPSDPTFKQFECRVTPNVQTSFLPCGSSTSSSASFNPSADGTYTFEVRAVDWSGWTSASRSQSWTVDKTGPFTNITSGPTASSFSNNNSPTFGFSANEPSSFQCSLDSGTFSPCTGTNSQSYSGLSEGQHTFSVRGTDSLGNLGGTVSRTWTIDTVLPETTLDPNVGPDPDSSTQNDDPVFQFSSNETGATFECNLTGPGLTSNAFTACTSEKSYPNLKDGTYTFKVRAKDRAGNVDTSPEERTWTINNTPTVLDNPTSLEPDKGATNVLRNTNVSATFSEEMAAISLKNPDNTSKTFKLQMYNKNKRKWVAIPATIALTNTNQTATLDPYGATEGATERLLAANKKFRALITTGAKDADGNPLLRNFVWNFTTGR